MKNIGDCSSFTEQITVKVFNYNDLCRFNVTNRSLRPTVVTDSNLDMGFCRNIVASDNCLPGSILCNLATVSNIVTIRGKPVIEIFESFDGSYWFATEKAWKQDSLIDGKVYRKDQIFFGYTRLSHCPELAEFGYFSEAELKSLGWMVWKVEEQNWQFCPEVEVEEVPDQEDETNGKSREMRVFRPAVSGAYQGWGEK